MKLRGEKNGKNVNQNYFCHRFGGTKLQDCLSYTSCNFTISECSVNQGQICLSSLDRRSGRFAGKCRRTSRL